MWGKRVVVNGPYITVVVFLTCMVFSHAGFAGEKDKFEKGLDAYYAKDFKSAHDLIIPLASKGEPPALNLLGMMYELGQGVTKDPARSVNYYRQAANKGYSYAQYNLAVSYDTGNGVSLNYREAVKWYQRAAEQGASFAQYNLGVMYEEGRGIVKDYKKAAYWYKKAAVQGNKQAQNNLAWLYERGQGIGLDLISAYAWFDIAAEEGLEPAIEKRELIKTQLTQLELKKAISTANSYRKSIKKSIDK